MPTVSVVIPTRGRPELVCRAVASVLAQLYEDLEVVVVIDGYDPATVAALQSVRDARLRIVQEQHSVGGSGARNIGFREAVGTWVALLDDDDEWFPEKLSEQMVIAEQHGLNCFIACRYIDRGARADIVQPFVAPGTSQPISEYLFCEISLLGFRSGFLQTSTWLAPRRAFLEVPFSEGLARNQDTDWLIRALPTLKLPIHVVWKTMVIFHNESTEKRITGTSDWRYSMNWAIERRDCFTRKAFPFFLAVVCAYQAKLKGEGVGVLFELVRVARKYGSISLKCYWLFFANWFVIPYGRFGLRSKLQNLLAGGRSSAAAQVGRVSEH